MSVDIVTARSDVSVKRSTSTSPRRMRAATPMRISMHRMPPVPISIRAVARPVRRASARRRITADGIVAARCAERTASSTRVTANCIGSPASTGSTLASTTDRLSVSVSGRATEVIRARRLKYLAQRILTAKFWYLTYRKCYKFHTFYLESEHRGR